MTRVTFIAPVNIAVVKYWGKKDETLILPLNDSLSVTLNTDEMCAKTTVMISPTFEKDRIWLNGREESFDAVRLRACLSEIRKKSNQKNSWKVHVCSENNFPTAAGLASSAAGYACLEVGGDQELIVGPLKFEWVNEFTYLGAQMTAANEVSAEIKKRLAAENRAYFVAALAEAFGVGGDLTTIARQGSGSACRSLMGGFVRWHKGEKEDGSDSLASQVESASHWPNLRILILVVSDTKKKVSSTPGMKLSLETSDLLKHRVSHIVPQRIEEMTKAIKACDFEKFAELTMKDSNNMHSVCLDTFPPLTYMNDISHRIVEFTHAYNKMRGSVKLAYTFDAGPNAVLFLEKENVPEVLSLIKHVFPPANGTNYVRGLEVTEKVLEKDLVLPSGPQEAGLIKFIIHTSIGKGPKQLKNDSDHLLDTNGLPCIKTES